MGVFSYFENLFFYFIGYFLISIRAEVCSNIGIFLFFSNKQTKKINVSFYIFHFAVFHIFFLFENHIT